MAGRPLEGFLRGFSEVVEIFVGYEHLKYCELDKLRGPTNMRDEYSNILVWWLGADAHLRTLS